MQCDVHKTLTGYQSVLARRVDHHTFSPEYMQAYLCIHANTSLAHFRENSLVL